MTRAADLRSDAVWEDAGRRVAPRLDGVSSAVVVGRDPRAVALAALGIARLQSARRRVAVADLIGESEPLQSLVTDDDVHGIVDSFVYGVSLNRIARQVVGFPNLFVLPSGSEPIAHDEVFRNPRWRRLSGGFQEVGALLLLAVTDDSAALASLIANTDGAVVVGTEVVLGPEVRTLATVLPLRGQATVITPDRGTAQMGGTAETPRVITPDPPAAIPPKRTATLAPGVLRPARRLMPILLGGGLVGLLAAVALARRGSGPAAMPSGPGQASSGAVVPSADVIPLAIANPEDSARALGWSVRVVAHNTEAGAMLTVRETLYGLAALTYSPLIVSGGARWYQVYAGAFSTREQAEAMLRALRDAGRLEGDKGQVVERPLPLSLRLLRDASATEASVARNRYLAEGIPAYALAQEDGSVTVYAGAYESEAHAALAVTTIRSAHPDAVLAYRTGRP